MIGTDPASTKPSWRTPTNIDGRNELVSISCPSTTLCVGVGDSGDAVISTDPAATTPSWTTTDIDGTNDLTAVSCPSTSLCVAVDGSGNALFSTDPTATTPTWSTPTNINGPNDLITVSCASTSLCVAVDGSGHALISTDPAATTRSWSARINIDSTHELSGISCVSNSLCVAVDASGDAVISTDPTAAAPTWSTAVIDVSVTSTLAIRQALTNALATAFGKHPNLNNVVKDKGSKFTFTNPGKGKLTLNWYIALDQRRGPAIATFNVTFAHAETVTVKIPLANSYLEFLKHFKNSKIIQKISYTPTGGKTTTITKTVTFKR